MSDSKSTAIFFLHDVFDFLHGVQHRGQPAKTLFPNADAVFKLRPPRVWRSIAHPHYQPTLN